MHFITPILLLFCIIDPARQDFEFNILHMASFYSSFEAEPYLNGKTRYGIARIIHFVKQIKACKTPALYFDTMDWFTGTVWFSVHRSKVCAAFLKLLPVDALALGHTELVDGRKGVRERSFAKFMTAINQTVLCVNCHTSKDDKFYKPFIRKSKIVEIGGVKIGIIGYIKKNFSSMIDSKHLKFTDEIKAIEGELKIMEEQGIKMIILLSHGGEKLDELIAANTEGIDIIIGGHQPILYYNGEPPIPVQYEKKYPKIVKNKHGKDVLIVYAGSRGKFVGKILLTFGEQGNITEYSGNPVHMDESIEEDTTALELLKSFGAEVDRAKAKVVGVTKVSLNATTCRGIECNFGNLIADSFIDYKAWLYRGKYWTDVAIAFINGGAIRKSIELNPEKKTAITYGDLCEALPFNTMLVKIKLSGKALRKVLEHSITTTFPGAGKYLQVSGIQMEYGKENIPYQRITSLLARCQKCHIPSYIKVSDDEMYSVILPEFLVEGGDDYNMLVSNADEAIIEGVTALDCLKNYMEYYGTVQPEVSERLLLDASLFSESMCAKKAVSNHLLFVYTYIICLFCL